MFGPRSIKKLALKRVRSLFISYVEWNLNEEELARYFPNALEQSAQSFKRKMSPSMTSPKENPSRNQSGTNMVPGRCSGNKKKQKVTTQQDDSGEVLKLLTNAFKKS